MVRLTKPYEMVVFTSSSSGRPEHGTIRSNSRLSRGTQSVGLDYYLNMNARDLEIEIDLAELSHHSFIEIQALRICIL